LALLLIFQRLLIVICYATVDRIFTLSENYDSMIVLTLAVKKTSSNGSLRDLPTALPMSSTWRLTAAGDASRWKLSACYR